MIVIMIRMMIIVPHVVLVGRALSPRVLITVGSQLLMHLKGAKSKAFSPIDNISIMKNVIECDSNGHLLMI